METSWVNISISRGPIRGKDRNKVGLIVNVEARKEVEEYISGLGQGRRFYVDAAGDSWYNCSPDGGSLEVYDVDTSTISAQGYTIGDIGGSLFNNPNDGRRLVLQPQGELVNLSFLRLVGISNPGGVSVGIAGAYSLDYIKKAKTLFPPMIRQFLYDYLVPVTINLQVIGR